MAMFQADLQLASGANAPLDAAYEERALYTVSGTVEIAGDSFGPGQLLVLRPGDRITLRASAEGPRAGDAARRRADGRAAAHLVEFRLLPPATASSRPRPTGRPDASKPFRATASPFPCPSRLGRRWRNILELFPRKQTCMSEAAALQTMVGPRHRRRTPRTPYERQAQTFPRLDDEQVGRAKAFGSVDALPKGTVLFSRGDRTVDFFLVLEGNIEIYDDGPDGRAERHHRPRAAPVHRRAGPVQRPRHPGRRPHGRGRRGGAHEPPAVPAVAGGRAGHRRDHHARLHPAPGGADAARARRGDACGLAGPVAPATGCGCGVSCRGTAIRCACSTRKATARRRRKRCWKPTASARRTCR